MTRDEVYSSVRLAGLVERYHAWPTIKRQTVAEHCWRAATIWSEVFDEIPPGHVYYRILHHDSGELFAGDVPFGAKQLVPGLHDRYKAAEAEGQARLKLRSVFPLSRVEQRRLKICDLLEMAEFACHEMQLGGGSYAHPILEAVCAAIFKTAKPYECTLIMGWVEHNSITMPWRVDWTIEGERCRT
jgi:5'-deoxynucleotidase YfbR-like HD superfamily hydrolase